MSFRNMSIITPTRTASNMGNQSKSLFGSIKSKLSRGKSSSGGTAEQRLSRSSFRNMSNNPFADPASPGTWPSKQQQGCLVDAAAPPDEAPPSYTANAFLQAPGSAAPAAPRRDASPAPSLASVTSAEDRYAFLSTFDTVFVIDDSGSMAGRSWREVRDALQAITPICTSHDADGIDVFFLNHSSGATNGGYSNIRDAAQVQRLFDSVQPRGATPTGARLHKILRPYVESLSRRPNSMEATKPVNIIVITDGCPTDDPESIIVHHARKLDALDAPPYQVGIQFFQVGNEAGASRALRELDDDLAEQGIRDMVDTVTWDVASSPRDKGLTADGILKAVLGAVVRRLDRRAANGASRSSSRMA